MTPVDLRILMMFYVVAVVKEQPVVDPTIVTERPPEVLIIAVQRAKRQTGKITR